MWYLSSLNIQYLNTDEWIINLLSILIKKINRWEIENFDEKWKLPLLGNELLTYSDNELDLVA